MVVDALRPARRPSAMLKSRTAVAGEHVANFEIIALGIRMEPTIRHGDTLLVSPEIELAPGRIVVAIHGAVWIVKRLVEEFGVLVLRSDNVDEQVSLDDVEVQGVVVEIRRSV